MTEQQKQVLLQLLNAGTRSMGLDAFEGTNAVTISGAIKAFGDLPVTEEPEEDN
jgi:hypothetical protein